MAKMVSSDNIRSTEPLRDLLASSYLDERRSIIDLIPYLVKGGSILGSTLQTKNFPEIFSRLFWNYFFVLVLGGSLPHSLGLILPSLCVMFTKSLRYLSQ